MYFLVPYISIFPPHKQSCGKVMFSQVCLSVHGGGADLLSHILSGGGYIWYQVLPGGWVCPGGGYSPPGYYGIRSTSGRYASYWNAFLFIVKNNSKLRWVIKVAKTLTYKANKNDSLHVNLLILIPEIRFSYVLPSRWRTCRDGTKSYRILVILPLKLKSKSLTYST